MGKTRKKKGKRWDHPDYKKGVYCFERDGYIHTYVFGERKSIKNLPWNKTNKDFAIQVLDKRALEYFERENGFNSNKIETFTELFVLYKEVRFPQVKKQSRVTYVASIKQVMKDNDLFLLDHIGMTKFFSNRASVMKEKEGYANSTIRSALVKIKSVFEFAIDQDIIRTNPIKSWLVPTKDGFKFIICSRTQLNKVLDVLQEYISQAKQDYGKVVRTKLYFALKLASLTGMRINEIVELKPEYIQSNKLIIFGKNERWREFPFSVVDGLKELLSEILEFHNNYIKDETLLGYKDQRNINSHLHYFMNVKNLVDCKEVKFHAIRKLVENEMMNDYTLNDNVVRSLIGHTIQTQSKHYINKMSAEDIEEVISSNRVKK